MGVTGEWYIAVSLKTIVPVILSLCSEGIPLGPLLS